MGVTVQGLGDIKMQLFEMQKTLDEIREDVHEIRKDVQHLQSKLCLNPDHDGRTSSTLWASHLLSCSRTGEHLHDIFVYVSSACRASAFLY